MRLDEELIAVTRALGEAAIPYALVGGLAVGLQSRSDERVPASAWTRNSSRAFSMALTTRSSSSACARNSAPLVMPFLRHIKFPDTHQQSMCPSIELRRQHSRPTKRPRDLAGALATAF